MICFENYEHGREIAKASPCMFAPGQTPVISRVTHEGKLMGGVIYDNHVPSASIGMHVASFMPNWLNNDFLWVVFDYPFNQLSVRTIFGQVQASNTKALAFDLRLGFNVAARIADVFPDGDLVLLKMQRKDCKWLKLVPRGIHSGKQSNSAAPA
jgi:RimJ/RimL family protein N-acetyltransferase